jgi:hypothetical protein
MSLVVLHYNEMATNRWDTGFLHTGIHNVPADTYADGNKAENDPVSNPRPFESFVVGPWLNITDTRISPMNMCRLLLHYLLSFQPVALENTWLLFGRDFVA